MPPSASLTYTYCTSDDIDVILSVDGDTSRGDDDASGTLSPTEAGYRTTAIAWGTARCNFFLLGKYAAANLAQSWIVNRWCSIVSAHMYSCRRGNPSAGSLRDLYDEAMEDMRMVQSGEVALPDTALRTAAWPAWSNVRVFLWGLRKVRVERPISESRGGEPREYQRHVDRLADFFGPEFF